MNPIKALIDTIIPPVCHICGENLIPGEEYVCLSCECQFPRTHFENYWLDTSGINTDLNPMEERFAGQIPLERAIPFLFYSRSNITATLVHDFKYRNFPNLATRLGALAAGEIASTGFFNGIDLILPVPLHWIKQYRRGYNQSERIARGISSVTGIPVGAHLRAVKGHRTQTSLTREERMQNTAGVFGVRHPEQIDGRHLLLVDDICTSGATLLSAAKAVVAVCPKARFSILTIGFAGLS